MIPCFNEASSVGTLLKEIAGLSEPYDTIVVDDGSDDDTFSVASKLSPCLRLAGNVGIGGAVQAAIKYAWRNDYDLCVQVDGDGQHPPDQVRVLLERYRSAPANIIVGSRFLLEDTFRSTWARRFGSRIIRRVIRTLFGAEITDPTSGLRLMDRKAIHLFSKEYPADFPEPISLALALERGVTVTEVPVRMRSREFGTSSISGIKTFIYMVRVLGYLMLTRMGRHL